MRCGEMDGHGHRRGTVARLLALAICLAVLAACGDDDGVPPPAPAVAELEPLRIRADAEWIRDDANRVVIVRGANYSGLEFGNFVGSTPGPRQQHFAQLASWGVTVVRLPIAWSYIEPEPNAYTDSYLREQVDTVIGWAEQHGIRVVLDMHHYYWSECVGGLGAPRWVCEGRSYPPGEGGLFRATCDFFRNRAAPDGRPQTEHFLDAWRLVVRHYANDPRVIGWDYFNEPYGICFGFNGGFERDVLHPFYRRMREITREEGAERTFFYCPTVTRNLGLPTAVEPLGPNVVYAPHLYGNAGGAPGVAYNGDAAALTADYELALQEGAVLGGPLVVGEYGGNANGGPGFQEATALFYRHTYAELDRRLSGGTFWAYFPSPNGFSVVEPDGREKDGLVDAIVRPYARRIAGIPTAMHFDADTKEFSVAWRNDPQGQPQDPTEIFVPAARHYPDGYQLELTPGDRAVRAGDRLLVYRGRATVHTVVIRRGP